MTGVRVRLTRRPVERVPMPVGDKVKFEAEKRPYTVCAVSGDSRWVICTKPFNPRRTVLYTIIDFDSGIRGPDDHWGLGYETPEQIARAMEWLEDGRAEVSVRRDLYLDIEHVQHRDTCPATGREDARRG